jgi:hypothetical protein
MTDNKYQKKIQLGGQPNSSVYCRCVLAHLRGKLTMKTDLGLIYKDVKRDIHFLVMLLVCGHVSTTVGQVTSANAKRLKLG